MNEHWQKYARIPSFRCTPIRDDVAEHFVLLEFVADVIVKAVKSNSLVVPQKYKKRASRDHKNVTSANAEAISHSIQMAGQTRRE